MLEVHLFLKRKINKKNLRKIFQVQYFWFCFSSFSKVDNIETNLNSIIPSNTISIYLSFHNYIGIKAIELMFAINLNITLWFNNFFLFKSKTNQRNRM